MTETFELRKKPELKIILKTDEFEVIDDSEPKNSGIYSFSKIKEMKLNDEWTNWIVSAISFIVDLMIGSGLSKKYKNKANLIFEMENQSLKLSLIDADFEKAENLFETIENKKTNTQQRV